MGTIYQCLQIDNRYSPPIKKVVFEAASEVGAIDWLEQNGGGVYKNILHNFEFTVKANKED